MQAFDGQTSLLSSTPYTAPAEAVRRALDNFNALLSDADFTEALDLLHVGRFQFLRRRQMKIELGGVFMALWRLALARSFPQDADRMFEEFRDTYGSKHTDEQSTQLLQRAVEYWAMLAPRGDKDFSEVSRHLCSFSVLNANAVRSIQLKMVLYLRKLYKFLFERLI